MKDEERAEEYIINKYKLNKCYIEDTEETRVYMHNDVHSEYEEEYQLYLDGLTEGRQLGKEEQWLVTKKAQKKTSATIRELKKEIKYLKERASANLMDYLDERKKLNEIKNYLAYDIPHELMNEATNKIWRMI